jgi:Right handed beta helix region
MILKLLLAILLIPSVALATGNETINILPDSNKATFRTDSRNFWQNEMPDVLGRYLERGFISSGGIHGTSASCTSPQFSFEVFTDQGNRVTADGAGGPITINYITVGIPACSSGTGFVHVSACAVSGNNAGNNWFRYGTTNVFTNFVDPVPVIPTDCAALMDVTITNGSITKIVPAATPTKAFPFHSGVSIEEVGGVCDGVTDNSAALQRAMNLATANGTLPGKLVLTTTGCTSSAGYRFTTPLLMPANLEIDGNNASLTFDGAGGAISRDGNNLASKLHLHDFNLYSINAGAAHGIYIANTSDVIIDKVTIEGRARGSNTVVGNNGAGISITTSGASSVVTSITVSNSYIRGNKGYGIGVSGTSPTGILLVGNTIESNAVNGMLIFTTGGFITARDNLIRENGTSTPEVRAIGFQSFTFINNVVTSLVTSTNVIEIAGGAGLNSLIRVDGNYVFATTNVTGISVNANNPMFGNSVSNNRIVATVNRGISITGSVNNFQLIGNSCAGATVCVEASELSGTTVLKGINETLVRKVAQGNISPVLANSAAQSQMYSAPLHAHTLSSAGQVRIRSNWLYLNASGAPSTVALVLTIGGTQTASCFFFANPSVSLLKGIFWDIDLAAQNSTTSIRASSRCGITDGVMDASNASGGGAVVNVTRMHDSIVNVPTQITEANTTVTILGSHEVANANTSLFYQNITIEALGQ